MKHVLFVLFSALFIAGCNFGQERNGTALTPTPVSGKTTPTLAATPTDDPRTANWETFRVDEYGFVIRHPSDWIQSLPTGGGGEAAVTSFDPQETPNTGGVPEEELKVAVVRFEEGSTIYSPPSENDIVDERQMTVAGRQATWRRVRGIGENISIELQANGYTYLISAYPADSEYIDTFELMVDTFRLIDSADGGSQAPVQIDSVASGDVVTSPLEIEGEAPGTWFFEAIIPVELRTLDGEVLATEGLQATEDWMQEGMVSFTGTLTFSDPGVSEGQLVIMKANPSGLPEHADEVSIPVRFE